MTPTRRRLADLLLRIQGAFLDTPGLTITLQEARLLFGIDEVTCAAILKVLVDSNVLTRTRRGAYVRLIPFQNAA